MSGESLIFSKNVIVQNTSQKRELGGLETSTKNAYEKRVVKGGTESLWELIAGTKR